MQVIDVRDLALLVVLLIEQDLAGAYNAVGPWPAVTLGELIGACGGADLIRVNGGFRLALAAARRLLGHHVQDQSLSRLRGRDASNPRWLAP
jgi:hypothetical protein